jgi:signal transduction histidine kinase
MVSRAGRFLRLRFGGDRTFVALFGVAYLLLVVESLASPVAPLRLLPTLVLGLAVFVVGTVGFDRVAGSGGSGGARSGRWSAAYFAVQLLLCATLVYLSGGAAGAVFFLVVVAGQSVSALRLPWMASFWAAALLTHSVATPHAALAQRLQEQLGLVAAMILAVAFGRAADNERRAYTKLDEANRRLKQYASRAEELAAEQERNRIARDIHDGLGHYLTAIGMQVKAARAVLDGGDRERTGEALRKAEGLAGEALSDVRRSVGALHVSPTERPPLSEVLAVLVRESRTAGIPAELVVSGTPRVLSPQAEEGLYRAAQEGLTNVRKHSGASRADLALDYRDEGVVRLSVRDDGAGTNAGTGGFDGVGFGLTGLRERAGLLGGKVETETAPGEGLTLRVEVPG